MVKTLVINNTSVVANSNNSLYRYSFPMGQYQFNDGDKIALQSLTMPYSWFNVSQSQYNNTSFQMVWDASGAGITININLPNPGYYDVTTINQYFQSQMIANGMYLINSSGQFVYYAEIVLNLSRYAYQINTYTVPTSLPTGWTAPSNWVGFGTANVPRIIISSSNNFGNLLGFNAGSYPPAPQTTNYSILSNKTPVITPVISVLLQCNILNNTLSIPSKVLYGFSPTVSFGNNIIITPSEFAFTDIQSGYYSNIDIQLTDQNGNNLILQDPNIVLQMVIKSKDE